MASNGVKTWIDRILVPFKAFKEALAADKSFNEQNKEQIDYVGSPVVKSNIAISGWIKQYWYVPLLLLVVISFILRPRR